MNLGAPASRRRLAGVGEMAGGTPALPAEVRGGRGSGFRRIQGWMEAAGLDRHRLREVDGYLELVLPGPGDDLGRLKIPPSKLGAFLPQKLTAQLNERQQKIAELLASGVTLTSRFCEEEFGVSRQTSSADFALLIKVKIAARIGSGRSTAYAFYDAQ